MSLEARSKGSRYSSGEIYVRSEMASNNPGFFGFILWNRQQYFVCIFGFFSCCNLRLRLQLILSVEILLHQKDLTLEQWEKRSLSGQIFFIFAFPKETYIITILVYLPISVQGAWTEMLSRLWYISQSFWRTKACFRWKKKNPTAVKLSQSDENQYVWTVETCNYFAMHLGDLRI